jgi:hypothetical protein
MKLAKTLSHFAPKKGEQGFPKMKALFDGTKKKTKQPYSASGSDESSSDDDNLRPTYLAPPPRKHSVGASSIGTEHSYVDGQDESEYTLPIDSSTKSVNPLIESVVALVVQIFDFKEQLSWLKDTAALKLIYKFSGMKNQAEKFILLIQGHCQLFEIFYI